MSQVQLTLPEGFEQTVSLTPAELESQIWLMAALKMFELGKLSSGKAAELAGCHAWSSWNCADAIRRR